MGMPARNNFFESEHCDTMPIKIERINNLAKVLLKNIRLAAEEPKSELKYKTIEEFLEKSGYSNADFSKSKIFNFDVCDLTIYKLVKSGTAECMSFYGATLEEAEQKLLEWANNENII